MGVRKTVIRKITIMASVRQDWQVKRAQYLEYLTRC